MLIDVFFHKVQLIIHPAFVKLDSIVFEQNVKKYPQVFDAMAFQFRKATKPKDSPKKPALGAAFVLVNIQDNPKKAGH